MNTEILSEIQPPNYTVVCNQLKRLERSIELFNLWNQYQNREEEEKINF